ncbi:MAG TPA: hypothetical protein DCS23_01625 [Candidatus Yonathbacteria bacterium]|nr:hypothetical protein [Candidatus Yonathbacteria bacterium]
MKFSIDTDSSVGYEKNSLLKKIFNKLYVPILNSLPATTRNLVKKTNYSAKRVIEKATTHEAIETLYKHGELENSKSFLQKFFHYIWFSTDNPKAVRNRLRLVTKELEKAIREKLSEGEEINLLSIAAGSARAILDSISIPELNGKRISVSFLDKNPEANEYSKNLVSERRYAPNYHFQWIVDRANNFPVHFDKNNQPNIIEIVGLLDYFDLNSIRRLFLSVYENLKDGGIFITSNIVDNQERKFITNVVGWNMIYKLPEHFHEIAIEVGFKDEDISIYYEPFKIHFVMVAKKR